MRRHRNRRRNKQRKIIIISICSILLFMTAGYAAMNTNLEINVKGNVIKKITGGEQLLETVNIITNGDGLYKDTYEENIYTYRGENPNNYVTFNNELWRIISVNTRDNTIKIIRNEILEDKEYDVTNARTAEYCTHPINGCNIWGSNSTLYDMNGINKINTLAYQVNGIKCILPNIEASLNIYLNEEYYNKLNTNDKEMVINGTYKVGPIDYNKNQNLNIEIEYAREALWKGNVALIDATEYIKASTDSNCTNMYNASWNYSGTPCKNNNWMFNSKAWWTLSPNSGGASSTVWIVRNIGYIHTTNANTLYGIRPVVTLKPEVKITSGDGSESTPFTFEI